MITSSSSSPLRTVSTIQMVLARLTAAGVSPVSIIAQAGRLSSTDPKKSRA